MFNNFTYLLYTLIFTIPLILFLWIYYWEIIKVSIRTVGITTLVLTLYGFFLWPTGLVWGSWAYNNEKLLGINIFGTVLEDIIWWILISLLLSSFVLVVMQKEQTHRHPGKRSAPRIWQILDKPE